MSVTLEKEEYDGATSSTASADGTSSPVASALPPPPPPPFPPPDGGLTAWLQVAGGFMLFFNSWGILNAFAVYQTYYKSGAIFNATASQISWIGSTAASLLLFTGIVAGPLYDRGHLRALLVAGTFLIVFAHMMLSLCTQYWSVVITQGALFGIGSGCFFVPCIAILPQYFSTNLGLAMGVQVSGAALGGIIYPIVLRELIPSVGFPWAVRATGFIAFATLLFPITVLRLRVKPAKVRAMVDMSAFTDLAFMSFVVTTSAAFMGMFVVQFYIAYYAEQNELVSTELAFYLVSIFNAGSVFGRMLPNIASDKIGPFNVLAPIAAITGLLMLCMMAVTTKAGVIAIAIVAGFMCGALTGLPPLCFVALAKDKSRLGTRMGMAYGMIAFGVLASGPSSGAILGEGANVNWNGVWIFGGVSTLVAGASYMVIRIAIYGAKVNIKA